MPPLELSPGVELFYRDDDFTDPWASREAIFLLHGFAENGTAWNGWVPHLARRFRVIRPDMRGFGRSTPMPADYAWSPEGIADDFIRLADHLGIERFHLVGAKVGGAISLRMAANHPTRIRTLTVTGASFISGRIAAESEAKRTNSSPDQRAEFERDGVESWARGTMTGRLGSDSSPEMIEGWIKLMATTPKSTAAGFYSRIAKTDVSSDMPRVACPTLVITIQDAVAGIVEAARERLKIMQCAELVVVPGDSYHVAVTNPDACARATIDFIERTAVSA